MTTPTTTHKNANAPTASTSTPRPAASPAIPRSAPRPSNPPSTTAQSQNAGFKHAQGGTAMMPSLSQMSNMSTGSNSGLGVMSTNSLLGASPSNHLLAFASPAALAGLDIGTPSALLDAAAAGSQPMNLSLSDLGIHSGKRNEDEERRAKLGTILNMLMTKEDKTRRFGRISEEGVRRVGRWAGLDVEVEAKYEAKQFEGNRPVAVAGKNNVLIDFTFKDNLPTHIDVSFFSEESSVSAHQTAAANLLMADLTPPPGVAAINTDLDRFASNLETLARLDKLSVAGQLNCFEAITGVYDSLRKLYEHEKKAAEPIVQAKGGTKELRVERHVLCHNSGRPQMHARRKIGLSLDYYMEKSLIFPTPPPPKDESAMDIDSEPSSQPSQDEDTTIHALEITAEACTPNPYTSLRVSSSWLTTRVLKPAEDSDPSDLLSGTDTIDWQDPPPLYLTPSQPTNPTTQTLPSARFLAKLNPPLPMPWSIASQILHLVNAETVNADVDSLRTYDMCLLSKPTSSSSNTTSTPSAISSKPVLDRHGKMVIHENSLFVPKQEFGYVLREIPFVHPREIVRVLPVLRQWVVFGALVRACFASSTPNSTANAFSGNSGTLNDIKTSTMETKKQQQHQQRQRQEEESVSLTDLLNDSKYDPDGCREKKTAIHISLSTSPSPMLEIMFPLKDKIASISLGVVVGGQIVVLAQNLVVVGGDGQEEEEVQKHVTRIARALEVTGDVGVWVEWVIGSYGGRG